MFPKLYLVLRENKFSKKTFAQTSNSTDYMFCGIITKFQAKLY